MWSEAILTLPKEGSTSSHSSSSSGLVTAAQAEIYSSVTGGRSQVCAVPLSISKEMSKSQNVKSFMFNTTKAVFQSGACLTVTEFMLRTDLVCYPQSCLCRVQPVSFPVGNSPPKLYIMLLYQGAYTLLLELLPLLELNKESVVSSINKFVLFLLTNHL